MPEKNRFFFMVGVPLEWPRSRNVQFVIGHLYLNEITSNLSTPTIVLKGKLRRRSKEKSDLPPICCFSGRLQVCETGVGSIYGLHPNLLPCPPPPPLARLRFLRTFSPVTYNPWLLGEARFMEIDHQKQKGKIFSAN